MHKKLEHELYIACSVCVYPNNSNQIRLNLTGFASQKNIFISINSIYSNAFRTFLLFPDVEKNYIFFYSSKAFYSSSC